MRRTNGFAGWQDMLDEISENVSSKFKVLPERGAVAGMEKTLLGFFGEGMAEALDKAGGQRKGNDYGGLMETLDSIRMATKNALSLLPAGDVAREVMGSFGTKENSVCLYAARIVLFEALDDGARNSHPPKRRVGEFMEALSTGILERGWELRDGETSMRSEDAMTTMAMGRLLALASRVKGFAESGLAESMLRMGKAEEFGNYEWAWGGRQAASTFKHSFSSLARIPVETLGKIPARFWIGMKTELGFGSKSGRVLTEMLSGWAASGRLDAYEEGMLVKVVWLGCDKGEVLAMERAKPGISAANIGSAFVDKGFDGVGMASDLEWSIGKPRARWLFRGMAEAGAGKTQKDFSKWLHDGGRDRLPGILLAAAAGLEAEAIGAETKAPKGRRVAARV